jgi:predicted metal-dependent hydrolase
MRLFANLRRLGNARPKVRVRRALLKIDGRSVEVILKADPRARRYIVKVDSSTGAVSVVAPSSRSLEHALEFAKKERDWIAERLAIVPAPVRLAAGASVLYRGIEHVIRAADGGNGPVWIDGSAAMPTIRVAGEPEHRQRRLLDWFKREARRKIELRVAEYSAALGVNPKRVTIRDTSSRWGSCSSTRSLSFSWRLVLAPPHVLDYVVAHEVAHLRELNHSARFWRHVESLVRDVEASTKWLSDNGALLHRYAPRTGNIG